MNKLLVVPMLLVTFNFLTAQTATAPSGSGTNEDPYLIATLNNLYWITQNSSSWNKVFQQTANIDASSSNTWDSNAGFTPIGDGSTSFSGTYDGKGYAIDGLYINRSGTNFQAMFGVTGSPGTIKNLGLTDVNITGNLYAGGLVGYNGSSGACPVSSCFTTGMVTGNWQVGGLIGQNYTNSPISNSYSRCTVSGISGSYHVGGLVGYNYSDISNSYSTGSVSGSNSYGGLIGTNSGGTVSNSFWDTQTSGQASSAAGTGKTTLEMKTQSTFTDAGWDFTVNGEDDDWQMSGSVNDGYPYLVVWSDASLPVELSSWTADSKYGMVYLHWTTDSELENLGFIIDRKLSTQNDFKELVSFSDLESLNGHGSTTLSNDYSYIDKDVQVGQNYLYRLSDVDYHGRRTYHAVLSVVVKAADETMLLDGFKLLPAYPNPFNPNTTISYVLPEEASVSLVIYDVRGQMIQTLESGHQSAGWYDVTWNGETTDGYAISTGIYFARLVAGDYSQVIKMLYLK